MHRLTQFGAFIAMGSLLFSSGCGSVPGHPFTVEGAPPHHIVMIDTNGRLVDPTGNRDCFKKADWQSELRSQLDKAKIKDPARITVEPCLGHFNNLSTQVINKPLDYFDDLICSLHAQQGQHGSRFRRVAIIVHGGLATNQGNLEAARDITAKMLHDPNAPYPIFINWQSNLWANLAAHLFKVRQGDSKGWKHSFLAPAYLAGDLAKAIGRAPATWFYHYGNDIDRLSARFSHKQRPADQIYCSLRQEYEGCFDSGTNCEGVFPISQGPFRHTYSEGTKSSIRSSMTNLVPVRAYAPLLGQAAGNSIYGWLPLKLITAPLLDGLGAPAWDTMIRHVKVGFHNDGIPSRELPDPDGNFGETVEPPEGHGGISRFMRRLRQEVNDTSCANEKNDRATCLEWQLTLIGHSMGAIMANEILYEFGDGPVFDKIVYMAAASSVRDYEQTVVEYLKRHRQTQMYHLTLHEFAEIRDQYFYEIPPSGSLLVWIDNFLSNPVTLRDRTVGRFVNLMIALPSTPRELRSRIHVKTFGVGEELRPTDPQHHGEFNNFTGPPLDTGEAKRNVIERDPSLAFWNDSFWNPEETYRPTRKERCTYEPMTP